ncbi:MAG: peptidoglycan editing factor PgeF [Caulobacterales bacterium]|nr:peptidoglycan editing factor PgeF [Caulobacterales bacterium]
MSDLPVLQSGVLAGLPGVRHAFFTRKGGVSMGLYNSLNVGRGSNDSLDDVLENRRRAAAWFGAGPDALNTCYQIHSATAVVADEPWCGRLPEGDAVVTRQPGIVCGVLSADCAPILFADAEARVVAAAHAGWQGALNGVVEATVAAMEAKGADRSRIVAAVGPCIAQPSYEVGLEYLDRFETARPGSARFFKPGETPEKRLFDLPGFVLDRLAEAGVERAEWIGRDSCAEPDWFFSNRRAFRQGEADFGRLMSAVMLT